MATSLEDTSDVQRLYDFGERLNNSTDKSKNESDYQGIIDAAKGSSKAKQLAAQLIPRYFKFFHRTHSAQAMNMQLDLCEEEELGVRVQAIRGLPMLCKDTPEFLPKMADVLGQLLLTEEVLEKDAVQKALMSVLRQDAKASLTALFNHVQSVDENLREKVLMFIREKVFPLKQELLQPQEEMERHITDLIKKSLQDVTGAEFKMFMDFLKSLNLFGEQASSERIQELLELVEGQADLHAQFNVTDTDHIDRLMSCLFLALPFYARGASNSKFLNYINKHLLPVFEKLPDKKLDLLRNLAESATYTSTQDARTLLPSILSMLKKYMPRRKGIEELNVAYLECLLYTFHQLARKTPNTTNSLCGYKIVTGQPSDRIGEDFSDVHKDFMERLQVVEDLAKLNLKKLTQGMSGQNQSMAVAKDEPAKADVKLKKQNTRIGLRTCNNIVALVQPLRQKIPVFLEDKVVNLSWKESTKPAESNKHAASTVSTTGVKRSSTAANGTGSVAANKRSREDVAGQQLVNRAFAGLSRGGRGAATTRGRGLGSWRGGRGRKTYR